MKKLFALVAVALTLCGLLTACGSKTETANDVDLTGLYNALAEKYGIEYQYGNNVVTWFSLLLFR